MLRRVNLAAVIAALMFVVLNSAAANEKPSEKANSLSLFSPDKKNHISFQLNGKGALSYAVKRNGKGVIQPSRLGFELRNKKPLNRFKLLSTKHSTHNALWEAHWGQQKSYLDHHNEFLIELQDAHGKRKLNLRARAFNDGVAFRYEFPKQKALKKFIISDELTEFNMTHDEDTWWVTADYNSYEFLYEKSPLSKITHVHTPLTMRSSEGVHYSIHEAALTDWASMTLKRTQGTQLKAELAPWKNGDKVRTSAPRVSPWRTIQLSDDAAGLLASTMILNLNEPNTLDDTEWITPMVYMGIWWEIHIGIGTWTVGDRHAATTERAKKYIDFASQNNIGGLLIEGWNKGWDKWGQRDAYVVSAPDFDLNEVAQYARDKGVRIVGHNETGGNVEAYEKHVEEIFKIYSDLGINTVKTGYVAGDGLANGQNHHGQWAVNHFRRIVELAAKHKIMLNVHEPIKDTGISRTYPNMMTREGARGLEYNAWTEGNPPSHTLILPFTRLLSGPMDYTGGIFDIDYSNFKGRRYDWWGKLETRDYKVHTTLARQLADMIIMYSPLQMASDVVENYQDHKAISFIQQLDMDFDESHFIDAQIGEYLTLARRSEDVWYLATATNEQARKKNIALDFLPEGKTYIAQIYRDDKEAHFHTLPEEWVYETKGVTSESMLSLYLAPGGGAAVILTLKQPDGVK